MSTQPNFDQPRILIIDDNPAIHEDFRKILGGQPTLSKLGDMEKALFGEEETKAERVVFRIDSAFQGREALEMVQKAMQENDPYALAFVDVRMPPGWDGIETLEHIWQCCPELQAVICTAYADYSWDDIAKRLGHTDNLLILKKPFETVEVLQMAHALTRKRALEYQAKLRMEDLDRMVRERTQELVAANEQLKQEIEERTRAQQALRISEEQFSKAFNANPMPMAIVTCPESRFQAANASFVALSGYSLEQLQQHTTTELRLWEDASGKSTVTLLPDKPMRNASCILRRSDGTLRNTILWAEPITLLSGPCILLIVEDVTEQLKLEGQLRQAQKMEAVGRLAAGVAHEFNNILTVIQGHAGLLRAMAADPKTVSESAARIAQACQRAATLTKQLLAFSRKQPLQFNPVNVGALLQSIQKMLGRVLGERYRMQVELAPELPPIRADESSVEQAIINLALNARDAMPDGGTIQITATPVVCDESVVRKNPEARAGRYVCVAVTDTGCGIKPELLNRIFDPFFTTKESGKGTGLGLSTTHGIVQQHKGWIEVMSQVGVGSTFKIFLPVWEDKPIEQPKPDAAPKPVELNGSGEAVLLVEDEVSVRELARKALEQGGYKVIEASDAPEAIELWEKAQKRVKLLVADIVLPNGMSGRELAKLLKQRDPQLRVVYTSGYGPEIIKDDPALFTSANFLPKPFDPEALLAAVKRELQAQAA
ncbi:MAG: response regulator [Verrucomicrobiae bacterium]|nr:response regulator [Verrucomicrobiae bacterium]